MEPFVVPRGSLFIQLRYGTVTVMHSAFTSPMRIMDGEQKELGGK